jgi:hypothetical protein
MAQLAHKDQLVKMELLVLKVQQVLRVHKDLREIPEMSDHKVQ